ncbi:unannotated protein [freshwater metagenome]|uniref:Unannotated protein n=1 Tax=freshwater metagenome TaxID=449393 RepID=A0A6J6E8N7_9ZZZZ
MHRVVQLREQDAYQSVPTLQRMQPSGVQTIVVHRGSDSSKVPHFHCEVEVVFPWALSLIQFVVAGDARVPHPNHQQSTFRIYR